ncbi:hypothetical protein [Turkeypox virus]|uniref:Uncharacterized protein n=1 Tax=Turkeypox virus TaxID=336486 RepID=A0A0M3PB56_9POXV|nr:hypothetical protein ASN15_gp072 [Turkeypox virus]ALA62446.1 hypothetical protein [Turkeypox virus]
MLSIKNLIRIYESSNNNDSMQEIMNKLPINELIKLVKLGFYPQKLNKNIYRYVSTYCYDKIFLFKPKYINFNDLLYVMYKLDNLSMYKQLIEYYKHPILCTNNSIVTNKCRNILHLHCTENNDNSIEEITEQEMIRMSKFPDIQKSVYNSKVLSIKILKEMYYNYGILPINRGIYFMTEDNLEFFSDVLLHANSNNDILYLVLNVNDSILDTDKVKETIIKKIHKGNNLKVLKYYVTKYSVDDTKLGIYYNIFFYERDIVSEYGLNDVILKNICDNMERYTKSARIIANLLINNSNYELLSSIIRYIPKDMIDENMYMNMIRYSDNIKPRVKDFLPELLSECLLVMCYLRGYEDVIDFLKKLDVKTMIRNKINPFTQYSFTTDWFNKDSELLRLYIRFYFMDPIMLRKLIFEYPLMPDSLNNVIMFLKEEYGSIDHGYAIDYDNIFYIIRLPRRFDISITEEDIDSFNNVIEFKSNNSYEFKITSQILKHNILKTIKVENLCYSHRDGRHNLCFNNNYHVDDDDARLINQISDLCVLVRHGFLCFMHENLGEWYPSINASNLLSSYQYTGPKYILSWDIQDIELKSFMRYDDIDVLFSKKYNIYPLLDKETILYSCIYSYLFVYIVIGSVSYIEQENNIYYFITNIINSFLTGLGINNTTVHISKHVIEEIKNIRAIDENKRRLISTKPTHLVDLCKRICVIISKHGKKIPNILYN